MWSDYTTVAASIGALVLVLTVYGAAYGNLRAVRANCQLRKRILDDDGGLPGLVRVTFDASMVMGTFDASPGLSGLSFAGNREVQKIFDRARTGGGFCRFTTRLANTGHLVTFLLFCESTDGSGGVVGRGVEVDG